MNYILITDLPRECIEDCGMGGGAKDAAVEHWIRDARVKPVIEALPADAMRQCLEGYGAWEEDELLDDDLSRERILWLACGTFAEYIRECEEKGIDPFGDRPDDFDPNCGSDLFSLE